MILNIIDSIGLSYPVAKVIYTFLGTLMAILVFHKPFYYVIGFFFTRKFKPAKKKHKYGILIAARNEKDVIGNLLDSINQQDYPRDLLTVFVVADNCEDDTAKIARKHGAIVYERFDTEHRTKGFALEYLLDQIEKDYGRLSFEGYFIFDADNLLKKDYISRMNDAFDEGCKIILAGRSEQRLDDAITYIHRRRGSCSCHKLVFDMMDKQEISNALKFLQDNKMIPDILVLNAGFFGEDDRKGIFRGYRKENFVTSWKTNYVGVTYLCEQMAGYMDRNGGGNIIMISSICALQKNAQYTPYGMAKNAATYFLEEIDRKYSMVSMRVVFPGAVATKMGNIKIGDDIARRSNKLNRIIIPEEIASLSAFLSSDVGKYVKDGVLASACEVL